MVVTGKLGKSPSALHRVVEPVTLRLQVRIKMTRVNSKKIRVLQTRRTKLRPSEYKSGKLGKDPKAPKKESNM